MKFFLIQFHSDIIEKNLITLNISTSMFEEIISVKVNNLPLKHEILAFYI